MWMLYDIWDLEWPCKNGYYTIYNREIFGTLFCGRYKTASLYIHSKYKALGRNLHIKICSY